MKLSTFFVRMSLVLLMGLASAGYSAAEEKRVALVIGNANYTSLPSLKNPGNDANSMADNLADLGFDVLVGQDFDRAHILAALNAFQSVAENADIAAIYFAGHGASVLKGNLVFGVDFNATDVQKQTSFMSLEEIQNFLPKSAANRLIFFDACQEPITLILKGKEYQLQALEPRIKEKGLLTAFASSAGAEAYDGSGMNSVFTSALLNNLKQRNMDLGNVLAKVQRDVERASQGLQVPLILSGLEQPLFFNATRDVTELERSILPYNTQFASSGFLNKPILKTVQNKVVLPPDERHSVQLKAALISEICARLGSDKPEICAK